jgi:hypothetical protein
MLAARGGVEKGEAVKLLGRVDIGKQIAFWPAKVKIDFAFSIWTWNRKCLLFKTTCFERTFKGKQI